MKYSLNDHFRWGWNNEWFNAPQAGGTFQVEIGSCQRGHETFRIETIRATKLIVDQFSKPVLVGLSGGSDSQVACLALRELKCPFTPVIMKLVSPQGEVFNQFDIDGGFEFCLKYNLKPIIETLDLERFYKTRGVELAAEHCLSGPQVIAQLYLVDKFKDTHAFIMAGGDLIMAKNWHWREQDYDPVINVFGPTPIQQHLIKHNIEGCTKFFMYTPELIASYLDNEIVRGFLAAQKSIYAAYTTMLGGRHWTKWWLCFNYFIKPMLYVKEWPELLQRKKYTGFEAIEKLEAEAADLMKAVTKQYEPYWNKIVIPTEELLEHVVNGEGAKRTWTANARDAFKER